MTKFIHVKKRNYAPNILIILLAIFIAYVVYISLGILPYLPLDNSYMLIQIECLFGIILFLFLLIVALYFEKYNTVKLEIVKE